MQLPKIITPEHNLTLPLSKKQIRYRPFLVKEEKILLTALEKFNDDTQPLISAVFQILQNCVLTEKIVIEELPTLDVEYFFCHVRQNSIGEKVELLVAHDSEECKGSTAAAADLTKVQIIIPEGHNEKIMITDTIGIKMKYPSFKQTVNIMEQESSRTSSVYSLVLESIESISNGADFAMAEEYSKEQLLAWIESFSPAQISSMINFFNTLPYLKLDIKYTCDKCKKEVVKEVRGTGSFFI